MKKAIAQAGLLGKDPDQKIIILKEAYTALADEIDRKGEKISRKAGRLMRQQLRNRIQKRDITNAIRIIEKRKK